jgi:hypothetical protein
MQRSDEVLKSAADKIGVKALAAALKLSPALIYKWCQEHAPDDPDSSGARNPLDRMADIYHATDDIDLINWLCHEADGFFVRNPQVTSEDVNTELLMATQRLVKEFSDMLNEVSRSIADDGQIMPDEAKRIRRHWETLKRVCETFVVNSEKGKYNGGGW